MDIQLQNGLTVRTMEVQYSWYPRKWANVNLVLYPTPGVAYQENEDILRVFGVQFHEDMVGQEAYLNAVLGKSDTELKAALISQWQVYQGDPDNYPEPQLKTLFEYVATTGVT